MCRAFVVALVCRVRRSCAERAKERPAYATHRGVGKSSRPEPRRDRNRAKFLVPHKTIWEMRLARVARWPEILFAVSPCG